MPICHFLYISIAEYRAFEKILLRELWKILTDNKKQIEKRMEIGKVLKKKIWIRNRDWEKKKIWRTVKNIDISFGIHKLSRLNMHNSWTRQNVDGKNQVIVLLFHRWPLLKYLYRIIHVISFIQPKINGFYAHIRCCHVLLG